MLRPRVIPTLLIRDGSLVKTEKFGEFQYIGDPVNTARIFNELEVDELIIQDISPDRAKRGPDFELIKDLASECFMPLAYAGGITALSQVDELIRLGVEKIVVNTAAFHNPELIRSISQKFGAQAVVVSIDVKKDFFGKKSIYSNSAKKKEKYTLTSWLQKIEELGAGEIILTAVDREGTWSGYETELLLDCLKKVSLPVIINGGAANVKDFRTVFKLGASGAAVGSMVVFQKKGFGVLVNFPALTEMN